MKKYIILLSLVLGALNTSFGSDDPFAPGITSDTEIAEEATEEFSSCSDDPFAPCD